MAKKGRMVNASKAATAPGFFIVELRPELAVMMMLIEAAKIGRTPSVSKIAPTFVKKLLPDASVIKNGGIVINKRNMLAVRMEADQMGCLAAIGTTWYPTAKIRASGTQP